MNLPALPIEVQNYFQAQSTEKQEVLHAMRILIFKEFSDAEDVISYGMPAIRWKGEVAVYYAVFTSHIGFYPTSKPIAAFSDQLASYKHSKGAIQFPLSTDLPFSLIQNILLYRKEQIEIESTKKAASKKKAART